MTERAPPWDQRRYFAQRYGARSGPAFEDFGSPPMRIGTVLKLVGSMAFLLFVAGAMLVMWA